MQTLTAKENIEGEIVGALTRRKHMQASTESVGALTRRKHMQASTESVGALTRRKHMQASILYTHSMYLMECNNVSSYIHYIPL